MLLHRRSVLQLYRCRPHRCHVLPSLRRNASSSSSSSPSHDGRNNDNHDNDRSESRYIFSQFQKTLREREGSLKEQLYGSSSSSSSSSTTAATAKGAGEETEFKDQFRRQIEEIERSRRDRKGMWRTLLSSAVLIVVLMAVYRAVDTASKSRKKEKAQKVKDLRTKSGFGDIYKQEITDLVYFDVEQGGHLLGRIVFGLFGKHAPKTVHNFLELARGTNLVGQEASLSAKNSASIGTIFGSFMHMVYTVFSWVLFALTFGMWRWTPVYAADSRASVEVGYAGSHIDRVVKDAIIEGGDVLFRDGTGNVSVFYDESKSDEQEARLFEDETFGLPHIAHVITMANEGRPNSNGSRFMITLQPQPQLNNKNVVFGRICQGIDVLRKIGQTPVVRRTDGSAVDAAEKTESDVPVSPIRIVQCDVLPPSALVDPEQKKLLGVLET